jgi:uncharacterized membrane protein
MITTSGDSSSKTQPGNGTRLQWLDALRGLLIVLMAIDHASFFIDKVHRGEYWGMPLETYTNAVDFLTRFVTHFCAPGFFFLMGIGMVLLAESRYRAGWSRGKVLRHFALRGVILIVLQFLLEDPAWLVGNLINPVEMLPPPGGGGEVWIYLGVLYGLGTAMIFWGLLLPVRGWLVLGISVGVVAVTQIFIPTLPNVYTLYSPVLRLLLVPGHTNALLVFYPLFPWIGIVGFGVAFGKLLVQDNARAYKSALIAGTASLALFFVLRLLDVGDFHPIAGPGWMAFFSMTKYPPSLVYILLTLGVVLLVLYLFVQLSKHASRWLRVLGVYGSAPLIFYLAHLYLYEFIGFAFPTGTQIGVMYGLWLVGLLILYPLCRWYGNFKQKTPPESLWRLF